MRPDTTCRGLFIALVWLPAMGVRALGRAALFAWVYVRELVAYEDHAYAKRMAQLAAKPRPPGFRPCHPTPRL